MFGDYASNLMFLPNPTRRHLLHFVAGGGFKRSTHSASPGLDFLLVGLSIGLANHLINVKTW